MTRLTYQNIPLVQPVNSEVPRMGRQIASKPESKPNPKPNKPVQKISVRYRSF